MSNIAIKGNASGTGSMTLESPNTNSDRTISLPDATCNMAYEDSSGNLQVNSGYGSKATAYGCRAWVNFNGTGTVAIRGSANVSSITDNAAGDYTVNFTNAMPDTNYAPVPGSGDVGGDSNANVRISVITTSSTRMIIKNASFANTDYTLATLAIFR